MHIQSNAQIDLQTGEESEKAFWGEEAGTSMGVGQACPWHVLGTPLTGGVDSHWPELGVPQ